jgi:hypothetical protein
MTKYNIEGGFDFYSELYKSLDEGNDQAQEQDPGNQGCLITHSPLTANFVTLDCNHKFNYIPLYNDILNHKKKYNAMERHTLKSVEIRCPYCRNIQNNLLPYYEDEPVKKVHGVNFFDESLVIKRNGGDHNYTEGACCVYYNDGITKCQSTYVTLLPENNKYYCIGHIYYGKKEATKELKIKEMKEIKRKMAEAKQKLVEEKLKAKAEKLEVKKKAQQLAKANKELAKTNKKNNETDGKMVQPTSPCCQILKSGPNKGGQCGLNSFHDNLCKRHYKIISVINNNNVKNIETL